MEEDVDSVQARSGWQWGAKGWEQSAPKEEVVMAKSKEAKAAKEAAPREEEEEEAPLDARQREALLRALKRRVIKRRRRLVELRVGRRSWWLRYLRWRR